MSVTVPVEVSARHIHLSQNDLERLFGKKYKLRKLRPVSQPGLFAAKETVTICGPRNCIENVRIIGPARSHTQVEVSQTDARILGLKPPVRVSGDLKGTPGCEVKGPKGAIKLNKGVIIAWRHLHCQPSFIKKYNLEKRKFVSVKINTANRSLTFHKVYLRVSPSYRTALHLDTDEGNAAGIKKKAKGIIIEQ